MSFASNTAAIRGAQSSGIRPSGGMAASLGANLDYREYAPSGNVAHFDGSAYGMRTFQPQGTTSPTSLSDVLGMNGLWYPQSIAPSGQTTATRTTTTATTGRTAADVAGDALHQTAEVVTQIIANGNALQLEQLRTASAERIAAINANNASISDPILRAQNEQLAHALQLVSDQAAAASAARNPPPQTLSPKFMLGAAAVGVVLIGGIVFAATRKNPVIGQGRSRHFVPQHKLDAKQRELARRAAKRARRAA